MLILLDKIKKALYLYTIKLIDMDAYKKQQIEILEEKIQKDWKKIEQLNAWLSTPQKEVMKLKIERLLEKRIASLEANEIKLKELKSPP